MDPVKFHRPSKRLGQNFLRDPDVASRIVSFAGLSRNDVVLEPGAGYGTLTEHLQRVAGRVIAVEKDRRLASYLRSRFPEHSSVQVVEGDVLKTSLPPFNKIVGTPPYNISSKLVLLLLSSKLETAHMVFQKEFGERLLAQPGTPDYGRLSVTAQRKLQIKPLLPIPRTAFEPRPKVDSILLSFAPKTPRTNVDEEVFEDLVRGIFVQRRRLLKGALTHYLKLKIGKNRAKEAVSTMTLPDARVYQLSVEQFEDLSSQLAGLLDKTRVGNQC